MGRNNVLAMKVLQDEFIIIMQSFLLTFNLFQLLAIRFDISSF